MKKKPKRRGGSELTGRYAYCPNSGEAHPMAAKQIQRSLEKGTLWFCCVLCGLRAYYKRGSALPKLTQEQAIANGALIPDEIMAFVSTLPPPMTLPPPPAPRAFPNPPAFNPLPQPRRNGHHEPS